MVIPQDRPYTVAQMKEEAGQGLDFGGGTYFRPLGDLISVEGKSVKGEMAGTAQFTSALGYITGLVNP